MVTGGWLHIFSELGPYTPPPPRFHLKSQAPSFPDASVLTSGYRRRKQKQDKLGVKSHYCLAWI